MASNKKKIPQKEENNKSLVSKKDRHKKNDLEQADSFDFPKDMPPEIRKTMQRAMMVTSSRGGAGHHPIFKKFTEGHVDKYLDYIQRDDDNEFSLKKSNRWFHLFYTALALCFFSFLIVYLLPKDRTLLNDLLKLLVAFSGGIGSGYGLKTFVDRKK